MTPACSSGWRGCSAGRCRKLEGGRAVDSTIPTVERAQTRGWKLCAWCGADMGECPGLRPGEISHGMCPTCFAREIGGLRPQEARHENP